MGSNGIDSAYGIKLTAQSNATNNYGIWMAGDGQGAEITFGAGKDDKLYHDSTNLVADCANAFHTNKGRIKNTTRVTGATYTVLTTDSVVFYNTDGQDSEATLPVGAQGQTLKIINSGTSGNLLTVDGNGSEPLLGATTVFNLYDGEALEITWDDTDGRQ